MNNTKDRLPLLHTFEEYEVFKSNIDVLEAAARHIMHRHRLPSLPLTLFSESTNVVFAYGAHQVIKLFPPFHHGQYQSEWLVLQHLQGKLSVHTPTLQYHGEFSGWPYIIMTKLSGTLLTTLWEGMELDNQAIIIRELGALIKEVHALPTDGLEAIDCHWAQFIQKQMAHCLVQHQSTQLPAHLLQELPAYLELIKSKLPKIHSPVILTGEYTPMNFLVKQSDGIWHIDGLIDFGDAMLGMPEYDLLGPISFLIQGNKPLLREFLLAYGYAPDELTAHLSQQLMGLMLLHQYSNFDVPVGINGWHDIKNMRDLEDFVCGLVKK